MAGFTEAFRREILAAREPISVTHVKPAAINTPFMEHARNRLGTPGTRNPPPSYDPDLVARAVLHVCQHRVRDITIGGAGGSALVLANTLAPGVVDRVAAVVGHASQTSADPGAADRRDNLYAPRADLAARSTLGPFTRKTSLALEAQLHPVAATAALAGALSLLAVAGRKLSTRA